jgi:adenosine kinase
MEMDKPQIIVCGSIAIDRIMNFPGRYRSLIKPDKLHVLSISVPLDKLETSPGGNGANISLSLARLGEKPALVGSAGEDAAKYIDELKQQGVDTSHVHTSKLPSASFNVITDNEGSQVGGFYSGAMADSGTLSLEPWQGHEALVIVSPNDPEAMNREVEHSKRFGIRLVFDPGQHTHHETVDVRAGVEAAEVVFVNDYELSIMCDRLAISPQELKTTVPILVTTLGTDGSLIEGTKLDEPLKIGIAKTDQVADPTGAGDGYRAGFLYGYLRQWDLKKCGQLGASVASLIVEQHGTQRQFSKDEVVRRYHDNFNEEIEL